MVNKKSVKVTRTVDKVVDGDTFKVKRKVGGSNYVRIKDIDSPEKNQKGYSSAKNSLKKSIEGKKVSITYSEKGHFGRPLAKVTQNRKNIGKSQSRFNKK